jgi:hypothetical protein
MRKSARSFRLVPILCCFLGNRQRRTLPHKSSLVVSRKSEKADGLRVHSLNQQPDVEHRNQHGRHPGEGF